MKVLTAGGVSANGSSGKAVWSDAGGGRRKKSFVVAASASAAVDAAMTEESPPANSSSNAAPPTSSVPAGRTVQSQSNYPDGETEESIMDPFDNDTTAAAADMDRLRLERMQQMQRTSHKLDDLYSSPPSTTSIQDAIANEHTAAVQRQRASKASDIVWLIICFSGIMGSFVAYGLLLEYATSGGKHLHELSFLFVTSLLYTVTASVGRYARGEKPSTIPPAQFAVLGLTSMGSTFFSVRALRYVIFPIQVLAKSCKPVPVMLMGAVMGKRYPLKKYMKVGLIVAGVGLFMGGGNGTKSKTSSTNSDVDTEKDASSQLIGVTFLFISLCFDGGTGAYEDKLMSVHSVGPFDLMYNIQLGKTILAGIGLIVLNQVHVFVRMCQDMGFLLVALGLSGAIGQVFIFVTIAKFGALTCAIIGLARKVATLVASIYFYGHTLNRVQAAGLCLAIGAMINDFFGKKGGGDKGGGHCGQEEPGGEGVKESMMDAEEERRPMLSAVVKDEDEDEENSESLVLEMGRLDKRERI